LGKKGVVELGEKGMVKLGKEWFNWKDAVGWERCGQVGKVWLSNKGVAELGKVWLSKKGVVEVEKVWLINCLSILWVLYMRRYYVLPLLLLFISYSTT